MAITAAGLGSGLDVKSLVDQLVAAERQPVATRLATQEARATAQLTGIGRLKSALAGFEDAVGKLADLDQFQQRTATVPDDAPIAATATSAAEPASYEVEVLALATAHRLVSGAFASAEAVVGTGQLVIGTGAGSMQIEITTANQTLAGIRDAINASANNPGLRASIVTGADGAHLILTATATGTTGAITVDALAPGSPLEALEFGAGTTNALTQASAAADASVLIDGLAVTSATNSIEGAIEGVSIDLLEAAPGETVTLSVGYDTDAARESVAKFVDAYNAVVGTVNELTAYNADTGAAGALLGDAATRAVKTALREALGQATGNAGDVYRTLAEIGISTATNGKLTLDAARLDTALDTDFDAVGRLFAGTDDGVAVRMKGIVEGYLAGDGRLGARETTLKARLEDISDRRSVLDTRMEQLRKRYQSQFNALDRLVSQLNQTSSFLTRQLENL
ncbi:MAG: flagellar filament capping protein FliD [Gammaproteobacteria bacterium]|nr:flagellar filament capping protein FliD [Gammaproteobacteria bacterium]